ncbi:hypothetical protein TcBrA4_0052740 [Trypanosoma cruzi]|nr:hypothetical protein TcBrA4_0052740 [Trypanosoma cruzi]
MVSSKQLRRLQARSLKTVYVHDWPLLLDTVLRNQWEKHASGRGLSCKCIPKEVIRANELFLDASDGKTLSEKKPLGHIPCGMIVWLVTIVPPTYYDSDTDTAGIRRIVMVANDIAFQSGSFAVPEDDVFSAASELARRLRVPFVYISANSGARLG